MLASLFNVAEQVRLNQAVQNIGPPVGGFQDPSIQVLDIGINEGVPFSGGGSINAPSAAIIPALTADMLCSLCQKQNNLDCISRHCSNSEPIPAVTGVQVNTGSMEPALKPRFNFSNQLDRHDLMVNTGFQMPFVPSANVPNRQFVVSDVPPTLQSQKSTDANTAPVWTMAEATFQDGFRGGPHVLLPGQSIPIDIAEAHQPPDIVTVQLGENVTPGTPFDRNINAQHGPASPINQNVHGGMPSPVQDTVITVSRDGEAIGVPTEFLRRLVDSSSQLDSVLPRPINDPTTGFVGNMVNSPVEESGHSNSGNANRNHEIAVATDVFLGTKAPVNVQNNHILVLKGDSQVVGVVNSNQPLRPINDQTTGFVGNMINSPVEASGQSNSGDANRNPDIAVATDVFSGTKAPDNVQNKHILVLKGDGQHVGVVNSNQPLVSSDVKLLETRGQVVLNRQPMSGTRSESSFNPAAGSQTFKSGSSGSQLTHSANDISSSVDVLNDLMNSMRKEGSPNAPGLLSTTTPIPTMDPKRRAELQDWSRQFLKQLL